MPAYGDALPVVQELPLESPTRGISGEHRHMLRETASNSCPV